jgi:hypothetical protein
MFFLGVTFMGKDSVAAFLHDSNARNSERCLELRARGGWEAYGLFWGLVELMRDTGGYRLSLERVAAIALGLAVTREKLIVVIEDCIRIGLFQQDEQFFWAPSLLRRMEIYNSRCEANRENGSKGGRRSWEVRSKASTNASDISKHGFTESEAGLQKNQSVAEACLTKTITQDLSTSLEEVPKSLEVPEPAANPQIFNLQNQNLSSGRFTLLKFPYVWMHQRELEDARKLFREAGLDQDDWRKALRLVNTEMEMKQHDNRACGGGLAYKFLTTHILTDAIHQKRAEISLAEKQGPPAKPPSRREGTTKSPAVSALVKSIINPEGT